MQEGSKRFTNMGTRESIILVVLWLSGLTTRRFCTRLVTNFKMVCWHFRSRAMTPRGGGNKSYCHMLAQSPGVSAVQRKTGETSQISQTMPQSYFSSHHSFSFRTCNNHQVYQSTTAATTKQQRVPTGAEIMSIITMSCANNTHTANPSYA